MERTSISWVFFSWEEQCFTEFWMAASYFALEAVLELFSAKLGVLQKAVFYIVLKCSSSSSGQYLWKIPVKNVF